MQRTISVYFAENNLSNDQQIKVSGQGMQEKGDQLLELSILLSNTLGMSQKVFTDRLKMLVGTYSAKMVEYKKLNNNAFEGIVKVDLNECVTYYPFLDEVHNSLRKKI